MIVILTLSHKARNLKNVQGYYNLQIHNFIQNILEYKEFHVDVARLWIMSYRITTWCSG